MGEDGQNPHASRREEQIGVLSVGDFFGEMALLSAKTIQGVFRRSQRRRCTVRAATVCMLQVLTSDDLETVAQDEPQLLVEMVNVARQREAQIGEDQRLKDLWEGLGVNFAANRFARKLKGKQETARQASERRGSLARLLARGAVNEIMLTAKQQLEAEIKKEEEGEAAGDDAAGGTNGGGTGGGGGVGFSIGGDEPELAAAAAAVASPSDGSTKARSRSCRARCFSIGVGCGGGDRRASGAASPVTEGVDDDARGDGKKKSSFARPRSSAEPGGGGNSSRRNSTRSSGRSNVSDVSPLPSDRASPPPLSGGRGAWARAKAGSGRSVLAFAAAAGAGGASSRVGMDEFAPQVNACDEFAPQVNSPPGGRSGGRVRDTNTEASLLGRVGDVSFTGAGPGLGALRFSSRLRNKANNRMPVGSGSAFMDRAQRDMMGPPDDDDVDAQQGPMEVDPEAMKHFLLGRTQKPLDLQSKYDHLKVQMERLMTSHREALNALQMLQSGQQEIKRCLAAAKASQASKVAAS